MTSNNVIKMGKLTFISNTGRVVELYLHTLPTQIIFIKLKRIRSFLLLILKTKFESWTLLRPFLLEAVAQFVFQNFLEKQNMGHY